MDKLPLDLPNFEPGWVWLVGGGPGDAGLLTLYGLHALRSADVLVYDALVGEDVLKMAREDCVLEYAGKRGGKPSSKQADISQRLIQLAKEGKRVLRLKGGDPFVFGRGGEEALALVEANVPFRVVPGISSGIGGLAYAGIPVTHRDCNSAVTFLTGHNASGIVPDNINWEGLAQGSPVIVIYMAIKHLGDIAQKLMTHGRSADEPVGIVSRASTPSQEVLETSLGCCVDDVAKSGIEPPALVVIGEVVRLRSGLDWMGAMNGRVLTSDPLNLSKNVDKVANA
ncbi:uroporphyrin-III methyltransferase [Kiloniella litopenaei]|uniref:uroporphyrinogen-III C-methyltransferase n=1 Tax=Kiloniella litopenaei TaxID=1549748 RepID=A0A0M2R7H6_9PROT|nr:uroporphyrinogen-III C-methyltransferase [Kiloniella litopenaei]KKJ75975.1 uroporphyrin-III methyltransferase [Kiloniella litopenaei]